MITGLNISKALTKHISCECKCKCKFDGRKWIQINDGITINVDVSVKNIYVKKIILGILLHTVVNMVNI